MAERLFIQKVILSRELFLLHAKKKVIGTISAVFWMYLAKKINK